MAYVKERNRSKEHDVYTSWDANQLIDLFVDMNFSDIESPLRLLQFRMVAQNVGYPNSMIDRVVDLGKNEYQKLLSELIDAKHPSVVTN